MPDEARHACAFCKQELASPDPAELCSVSFMVRGNSRKPQLARSCGVCTRNILERVWEMRRSLDFTERRVKRGTIEDSRPESS